MADHASWKRVGLTACLIAVNLVLLFTIGITEHAHDSRTANASGDSEAPETENGSGGQPEPYATVPPAALAAPPDRPRVSDQAELDAWADHLAERTEIPASALTAYGRAEMWMRSRNPECGISWGTLAAIGALASKHGTDVEERESWQHQVGPLRMRSTIWRDLAIRSSGDGAAPDPWDLGDAALTVARYLCGQHKSMREPSGWWEAVAAYRHSVPYAQRVFSTAKRYAATTQ